MKFFSLFLMTATLTFSANTMAFTGSPKLGTRIVGGIEVDPSKTDISYIVSIGGGCAGSIIDSRWILTAAHCKPLFNSSVTGGSNLLRDSKRVKLKVVRSFVHPEYSSMRSSHDFALLELAEDIDFEATGLSAIEIADSNFESSGGLEDGVMATVLGWGLTSENGSQPAKIRSVDVPLVSRERANAPEAYNNKIDEAMIVAGYDEGGKDSCQGDSGGPLVLKNRKLLIGVVSFGDGCARAKKYGVYSNVSFGNSWIRKVMNK